MVGKSDLKKIYQEHKLVCIHTDKAEYIKIRVCQDSGAMSSSHFKILIFIQCFSIKRKFKASNAHTYLSGTHKMERIYFFHRKEERISVIKEFTI